MSEYAVKSLGDNRLGGYGILWGTQDQVDLHGEYFTPQTKEIDTIFKGLGKIPGLYGHGMDGSLGATVTGYIDVMKADHRGVWVEEQLKISDSYLDEILYLVDQKKLFWSSGALPAAYQVTNKGHITRWPIMEMSKTPSPAEWRMVFTPISQVSRHYSFIGVDLPSALKSSGLVISDNSSEGDVKSREEPESTSNIDIRKYELDLELLLLDMEDVT